MRISKALITKLYKLALVHYPDEYGGILIGKYTNSHKTCVIVDTIESANPKASRFSFERGNLGLSEKLVKYYNRVPSLFYIGEWHTHPDGLPIPSSTDKQAMKEISENENVKVTSPLLLILGMNKTQWSVGVYVQYQQKLHKYEQQ